jgi:hypothetical protein
MRLPVSFTLLPGPVEDDMEQLLPIFNFIVLVGIILVALLLWRYLPSYLAEKAKNLATREDVEEITTKIESVKSEYQKQLQELQHHKNLLQEVFKDSLSRQSELSRTVNMAVVDLTRKLAAGSHTISWLAWKATVPGASFTREDFESYDKFMIPIMSDLIGLQAALAALDSAKFDVLSPMAEELYERDDGVGRAQELILSGNTRSVAEGTAAFSKIYRDSLAFDKLLLAQVTNLLRGAQPSTAPDRR